MLDVSPILQRTEDYIREQLPKSVIKSRRSKTPVFECPFCHKVPPSAAFMPGSVSSINCLNPLCARSQKYYTIFDLVRLVEQHEQSNDEIARSLAKKWKVTLHETFDTDTLLAYFQAQNFDLVPVAKNQKAPIEKDWTNKNHKDPDEWKEWLNQGLNIGVKTGKLSNVLVIDIDQDVPTELQPFVGETLTQQTNKGCHLFYRYDADLPKTRIEEFKIDIETDGGQVVVMPSVVEGKLRKFPSLAPIAPLPSDLKKLLQSKLPKRTTSTISHDSVVSPPLPELDGEILEGTRNNSILRLGGVLRKKLNLSQTEFVLDLINRQVVKPSLSSYELRTIVRSLDKYAGFDEQDLAAKILSYLKLVGEAYAKDVQEALGETKSQIDKALAYLVKEDQVIRNRRVYQPVTRVEWHDKLMDEGEVINFRMPYFDEHAVFRYSDLILVGGQQKIGKSHIALNIIKSLVTQGLKPYYITTESGNRFATIALQLGLKEGDFFWTVCADPSQVELEKGKVVTIIDWLLPKDYAATDQLYQRFVGQLVKTGGVLIVFAQLRSNNEFFARDMVSFFPALVAKYTLGDNSSGEFGEFELEYIREPKLKGKKQATIPCRYDWETRLLSPTDPATHPTTTTKV